MLKRLLCTAIVDIHGRVSKIRLIKNLIHIMKQTVFGVFIIISVPTRCILRSEDSRFFHTDLEGKIYCILELEDFIHVRKLC